MFLVVIVILVGAGVLTSDPSNGRQGAAGFGCRGYTTSAELNRFMCRYSPERIWNMKLGDVFPDLRKS